jgi:hypothetical protein
MEATRNPTPYGAEWLGHIQDRPLAGPEMKGFHDDSRSRETPRAVVRETDRLLY